MLDQVQTFPCASCRQIISDRAEVCRYCGVPVDRGVALILADTQGKVNQACSDASYLKIVAATMWFSLILWAGVVSILINSVFLITVGVLPFLLVRWQWRFGRVESGDRDFARARRDKNRALLLWLTALVVAFFLLPLLSADFDPLSM